jgi:hypothetical protein
MLTKLILQPGSDSDQEELDQLTTQLRSYLLDELDVDRVDPIFTRTTPDSAKAADALTVGALALALSPVTLHSMVQVVQTWLKVRPIRSIRITIGDDSIDVSHPTSSDQHQLIESFIERHRAE